MKFLNGSTDTYSLSESLTPLVDIIFLLVIFFLVSSTFDKSEQNLGIDLPSTKGKGVEGRKADKWLITIDLKGQIYFKEKVSTLEQIETQLKSNRAKKKDINVIIKADKKAPFGIAAQLVGLCNQYNYKKLAIQTINAEK
jgi:biopolymer transport protein ExbD